MHTYRSDSAPVQTHIISHACVDENVKAQPDPSDISAQVPFLLIMPKADASYCTTHPLAGSLQIYAVCNVTNRAITFFNMPSLTMYSDAPGLHAAHKPHITKLLLDGNTQVQLHDWEQHACSWPCTVLSLTEVMVQMKWP